MNGAHIGYARVSSTDQDLSIQEEALKAAGCVRIFQEKESGLSVANRDELALCLAFMREGDTLVITRLDRLGRSVRDLLTIVEQLASKGVHFKVLNQPVCDIHDSTGRLFFQILAAFAEFEANIRKERQREGVERARSEGRYKGRPKTYDAEKTIIAAREYVTKHSLGAGRIARLLGMNVRTLYRLTADADPPIWGAKPASLATSLPTFDVKAKN